MKIITPRPELRGYALLNCISAKFFVAHKMRNFLNKMKSEPNKPTTISFRRISSSCVGHIICVFVDSLFLSSYRFFVVVVFFFCLKRIEQKTQCFVSCTCCALHCYLFLFHFTCTLQSVVCYNGEEFVDKYRQTLVHSFAHMTLQHKRHIQIHVCVKRFVSIFYFCSCLFFIRYNFKLILSIEKLKRSVWILKEIFFLSLSLFTYIYWNKNGWMQMAITTNTHTHNECMALSFHWIDCISYL